MITDLLSSVHEQNQPEVCILSGFENYQFAPSGAAFTKATVTQNGRVAKIKVYQGSSSQLTADLIGLSLTFSLKSYMAQNNKIYISGFWNERAQQGQQAPQQPPQQQNQAQGTQSIGKDVRAKAMEIAANLIMANKHTPIEIYALSDFFADYILNGKHPTGVASANPQQDEDFPQEPG